MRSPEVSPSSLDVVIAPVICWQKRGTEKIWRLGKTSTPLNADVAQLDRAKQGKCRVSVVGSSPTVCTIGVTSCLAAARSVSLRKWSFLRAVRKRKDEVIYLLAGTGFVKMNGCDRRTGAGLKSSVVGLGTTVLERNPRRGCGVVAVVLGQSCCVG